LVLITGNEITVQWGEGDVGPEVQRLVRFPTWAISRGEKGDEGTQGVVWEKLCSGNVRGERG